MKRPFLAYVTISVQAAVAVWVSFYWKRSTLPQRCIILLLMEMALSSIVELVMGMNHIRNLWLIHLTSLLEFIVILAIFYYWKKSAHGKRFILILGSVIICLWCVFKLFIESIDLMDTYSSTITQLIFIVLAVSMFFDVLKDSGTGLKNDARVWFASGTIIYSVGTLFTISLFNVVLQTMPELLNTIWKINWVIVIIMSLMYTRAIWCKHAL